MGSVTNITSFEFSETNESTEQEEWGRVLSHNIWHSVAERDANLIYKIKVMGENKALLIYARCPALIEPTFQMQIMLLSENLSYGTIVIADYVRYVARDTNARMFSYDLKYAVKDKGIYSVSINDNRSGITVNYLGEISTSESTLSPVAGRGDRLSEYFSYSTDEAFYIANYKLYYIDYNAKTAIKLADGNYRFVKMLPKSRSAILESGSNYVFVTIVEEDTELIGLRYGGNIYYNVDINGLTATIDDVASGEKFIGANGIVETGRAIIEGGSS